MGCLPRRQSGLLFSPTSWAESSNWKRICKQSHPTLADKPLQSWGFPFPDSISVWTASGQFTSIHLMSVVDQQKYRGFSKLNAEQPGKSGMSIQFAQFISLVTSWHPVHFISGKNMEKQQMPILDDLPVSFFMIAVCAGGSACAKVWRTGRSKRSHKGQTGFDRIFPEVNDSWFVCGSKPNHLWKYMTICGVVSNSLCTFGLPQYWLGHGGHGFIHVFVPFFPPHVVSYNIAKPPTMVKKADWLNHQDTYACKKWIFICPYTHKETNQQMKHTHTHVCIYIYTYT